MSEAKCPNLGDIEEESKHYTLLNKFNTTNEKNPDFLRFADCAFEITRNAKGASENELYIDFSLIRNGVLDRDHFQRYDANDLALRVTTDILSLGFAEILPTEGRLAVLSMRTIHFKRILI